MTDTTGEPSKRKGVLPVGFVYDSEPAHLALMEARCLAPSYACAADG